MHDMPSIAPFLLFFAVPDKDAAKKTINKNKPGFCFLNGIVQKVGGGVYREAMQAIVDAWKGDPDSLRAETVQGVVEFVDLYRGEYSRKRLVTRLRQVDPVVIFREGRAMTSLPGYKRYLYQVYRIYNGSSAKTALPMKF